MLTQQLPLYIPPYELPSNQITIYNHSASTMRQNFKSGSMWTEKAALIISNSMFQLGVGQ